MPDSASVFKLAVVFVSVVLVVSIIWHFCIWREGWLNLKEQHFESYVHSNSFAPLGTSARWRQGSVLPFPPRSQRSQQKKDFPSETAEGAKEGKSHKAHKRVSCRWFKFEKEECQLTHTVLSTDNFPFLFYHSFLTKQEILFWRMWHAFFDEVATETKHAAVAKEFEYPYASPLDELRAVDKALWVFFYLRIL